MSRPERRKELREQFTREDEARRAEANRKEKLTLWERIEEVSTIEDVKDILHRLANGEHE